MSTLVLVADADPFNLHLLSELCGTLGYDVMTAADGGAVLDAMARERPSLVLMDASLPVLDGLNVLGILKADPGLCDVPVLLVTQETDVASRELGIALGARYCLYKPYRPLEVQRKLREIVDLEDLLNAEADSTDPGHAQPAKRARPRREVADPLTQLGTPGQLHISLEYEFTRAMRYHHALSCIVISCSPGQALKHERIPQGLITELADVIKGSVRNVDHVFRSDEVEFTILLPETTVAGAQRVTARLRSVLREHQRAALALPSPIAALPEIGVALASMPPLQFSDGEALYAAARRRPR